MAEVTTLIFFTLLKVKPDTKAKGPP
jgi:hypothetical protein